MRGSVEEWIDRLVGWYLMCLRAFVVIYVSPNVKAPTVDCVGPPAVLGL